MQSFREFVILPGSHRDDYIGAGLEEIPADFPVTVTVHLRRKAALAHAGDQKKFLTRAQLADEHGASIQDVKVVFEFAQQYNLLALHANLTSRLVILSGTAAQMSEAFKVKLKIGRYNSKLYRVRSGPIYVPTELLGICTGIFGLDNRPQARPHFRISKKNSELSMLQPNAFDGHKLANAYSFPEATGSGQTIALIELGGGYFDLDNIAYFTALGLPCPTVKSVAIGGASNSPGVNMDEDTEVSLDIQIAGAVSPGARIIVYFAPNTDQGFLQGVLAAVHDSVNKPAIISISWGSAECTWTTQQMMAMDEAFQSAAALGISIFVAAGDDGANDNVGDSKAHVDFPASSPNVTACGGTSLVISNGTKNETVWNDGDNSATGGGISNVFARPIYQTALTMPNNLNGTFEGRGVPDVAAVADPETGYAVLNNGVWMVVGGTSAVAPLFAGLTARINQLTKRPNGLLNGLLYHTKTVATFNDVTDGNNSCDGVVGYSASVGWDAVTGLGSPSTGFFDAVNVIQIG